MSGTTAFWYASRATGIVALLLLTAVFVLGILVNRQGRLPGLPRFAVTSLHRNFSLLAVVFIVVHVFTAVLDHLRPHPARGRGHPVRLRLRAAGAFRARSRST